MAQLGEERWLTVDDVAENVQVTNETVRRWIRSGELPALRLGGTKSGYRIRLADVTQFLSERYGPQKSGGAA